MQKRITMTHKYYDFYMRFPSFEDAEKAQKFYNETHKNIFRAIKDLQKNSIMQQIQLNMQKKRLEQEAL